VKRAAITLLLCIAAFGSSVLYIGITRVPPKESKFVQNFNAHRAAFERLRDMLEADRQLDRLGTWGVVTTRTGVAAIPPEGDFPVDRYKEYMALLKQVGGLVATREEGEHADPSIGVWGWGFAGNTRHIGICWMDQEPANQIATLDGYRSGGHHEDRKVVYRHIDANWYLWTDL